MCYFGDLKEPSIKCNWIFLYAHVNLGDKELATICISKCFAFSSVAACLLQHLHWKCEIVNNNKMQAHTMCIYVVMMSVLRRLLSISGFWNLFFFQCVACWADFNSIFLIQMTFRMRWLLLLFTAHALSFYWCLFFLVFAQIKIAFTVACDCGCHPFLHASLLVTFCIL